MNKSYLLLGSVVILLGVNAPTNAATPAELKALDAESAKKAKAFKEAVKKSEEARKELAKALSQDTGQEPVEVKPITPAEKIENLKSLSPKQQAEAQAREIKDLAEAEEKFKRSSANMEKLSNSIEKSKNAKTPEEIKAVEEELLAGFKESDEITQELAEEMDDLNSNDAYLEDFVEDS